MFYFRLAALSNPLTTDQKSFLKLLQKLLNSEQASKQLETAPVTDSDSTESLAVAMRRLFNMYSSPSLASTTASWHSNKSDDSLFEAVRSLFSSGSSTSNLPKTNSYPATPCNSADNLGRHKLVDNVKQSTSMREVLMRLLNANEEQDTSATSSDTSIWSLGEAMIKAFTENSSDTDVKEKCNLSTSNNSLSSAMHWLFDTLSQRDLDNSKSDQTVDYDSSSTSLGSVLLWGLTDSTPDLYKGVDVKKLNQKKKNEKDDQKKTVDCECHNKEKKEKKHPSVSSVIRTSSPDRDVNIAFPAHGNQHKTVVPNLTKDQPVSQANARPEFVSKTLFSL